jgi:hypothetical protein
MSNNLQYIHPGQGHSCLVCFFVAKFGAVFKLISSATNPSQLRLFFPGVGSLCIQVELFNELLISNDFLANFYQVSVFYCAKFPGQGLFLQSCRTCNSLREYYEVLISVSIQVSVCLQSVIEDYQTGAAKKIIFSLLYLSINPSGKIQLGHINWSLLFIELQSFYKPTLG